MGTRNLTMVISKGAPKIAQYCQWDGYLEGVGMEILTQLRRIDMGEFRKNVDSLTELNDSVIESHLRVLQKCSPTTKDQTLRLKAEFPQLSRDCCANIISLVAEGYVGAVKLNTEFAADSLYCEYCYVIDLDKETFEIYRGFNKTPLTQDDRFFPLQKLGDDEDEFFPDRIMGL